MTEQHTPGDPDQHTPGRRLGRRAPKDAPALRLRRLPKAAGIPTVPPTADHFSAIADWGLYANDQFGDCGPVSAANMTKLLTKYLSGFEVSVSQTDVFDLYRRSGNPNFDPDGDTDDNGVDLQTMLEAWLSGGLGDAPKPIAFAKLDHTNGAEVRAAIAIFGAVILGVTLDVAQEQQTDNGGPWSYVPKSEVWGGHAVLAGRYTAPVDDRMDQTDVTVVTWAELMGTTDGFMSHQLDEAWVVIFPAHLTSQPFLTNIDAAALAADYEALTGRTFPVAPDPGPVAPVPDPVPAPTPPVPAVDPADDALAAAIHRRDALYAQCADLDKQVRTLDGELQLAEANLITKLETWAVAHGYVVNDRARVALVDLLMKQAGVVGAGAPIPDAPWPTTVVVPDDFSKTDGPFGGETPQLPDDPAPDAEATT